ncbi:hypothetical protein [Halomarina oriensis]|uniref:Uncharacterized protein n=1 Tax=Halomarina oriensis TaxID=671145 RepID=A0A6B0GR63_9EURY|nr:hypothetical protein [Halomarina oriensis]MWG34158.1 hypothetical protein [Halomarina oriensis]
MSIFDGSNGRYSVRFAETVEPGETVELTEEVSRDATVERVTVRIYLGAELDLRVRPFVTESQSRRPLVVYQGKQYIDGDNDVYEFALSEPVAGGESIGVEVENRDGTNSYDFSMTATVDHDGGLNRAVSALFGGA